MRFLFLLLGSLFIGVKSLNILIFLIGTNQFERNSLEFLAQQLALRHHNVITVKPILIPEEPRLVKPKLHLVREKVIKNVVPKEIYQKLEITVTNSAWKSSYDYENYLSSYYEAHNASCYKLLNSNLLDSLKKESIDVAVVYSGNPCLLALTYVIAIPTIYYDTEGFTDETIVASATPIDRNIASSKCAIPKQDCVFCNIYRNAFCFTQEMVAQLGLPYMSQLASKRYAEIDEPITSMFANDYEIKKRFNPFPNVNEIKQNAVAFFVNSDPLIEPSRPIPSNVIYTGGMHIDQPKPLFTPWNTTIESAKKGMIIVSLGTQADASKMAKAQEEAIRSVLYKLTDYRIYWRIGPNMKVDEEKIPKHINVTTFIPQNDLLAHKACRLLITNGGMSSIMEAVAHGVPIVGIPLYGSNLDNLMKVEAKGLGIIVEKPSLTAQNLLNAVKKVLDTPKFKTVAKEMSREFKSRPMSPFETVLHTINHVGRHHSFAFFDRVATPIWMRSDFYANLIISLLPVLFLLKIVSMLFVVCCYNSKRDSKVERKKWNETKKNK